MRLVLSYSDSHAVGSSPTICVRLRNWASTESNRPVCDVRTSVCSACVAAISPQVPVHPARVPAGQPVVMLELPHTLLKLVIVRHRSTVPPGTGSSRET